MHIAAMACEILSQNKSIAQKILNVITVDQNHNTCHHSKLIQMFHHTILDWGRFHVMSSYF